MREDTHVKYHMGKILYNEFKARTDRHNPIMFIYEAGGVCGTGMNAHVCGERRRVCINSCDHLSRMKVGDTEDMIGWLQFLIPE